MSTRNSQVAAGGHLSWKLAPISHPALALAQIAHSLPRLPQLTSSSLARRSAPSDDYSHVRLPLVLADSFPFSADNAWLARCSPTHARTVSPGWPAQKRSAVHYYVTRLAVTHIGPDFGSGKAICCDSLIPPISMCSAVLCSAAHILAPRAARNSAGEQENL